MSKYIGSDFDDFLKEEGSLEAREVYQIEKTMRQQKLTKADLAKRMPNTVNRLFSPSTGSVQLRTLERAACAVGKN